MNGSQTEIVDKRKIESLKSMFESDSRVGSGGAFHLVGGFVATPLPQAPVLGWVGCIQLDSEIARRMTPLTAFTENITREAFVVRMGTSSTRAFRERELEWRRTHPEVLKRYENEWVVLDGEQIVAHGADPAQVIQQAKRNGILKPYIFFVEQEVDNLVRIGL